MLLMEIAMTGEQAVEISVVVPAYNEEQNITALLERITEVFVPLGALSRL